MVDDVSGAQLVSRLIKRWSDVNKVEINYKKCGIMELKRNQVEEQPAKDSDQLWERFPKVNNYKYLGITLNQSLLPKQHLEHLQNKLKKFKKMVIIIRLQGASVTNLMYLWIVFAESIFSYGSFIFALEGMTAEVTEAYARIYRKSLKYVLGVSQNTPNILAYLAAGVITPS